jgi:hypothetical protein
MREGGTYYGAHLAAVFEQRREDALEAMDDAGREQAASRDQKTDRWTTKGRPAYTAVGRSESNHVIAA